MNFFEKSYQNIWLYQKKVVSLYRDQETIDINNKTNKEMDEDLILKSLVIIGTERADKLFEALTDGSDTAKVIMRLLVEKDFYDCFAIEKWLKTI